MKKTRGKKPRKGVGRSRRTLSCVMAEPFDEGLVADPLPSGRIEEGYAGSSYEFPTLEYELVKKHHKRKWFKQKRLLILKGNNVLNARPRSSPDSTPEVTKNHPIRMIELIALKSKTSFMLRFIGGDHDYYYSSPKAVEIVWEINRRRGVMRAVEKLAPHGATTDDERSRLMRLFAWGFIELPKSDRTENDAMEKRMDLLRALRAGAVDGTKSLNAFRERYLALSYSEISLEAFREELTEERSSLVSQLITRQRSFSSALSGILRKKELPMFEDDTEATTCAEEALQVYTAAPCYKLLWDSMRLHPDYHNEQRVFEENRQEMAMKPIEFFGLQKGLENINIDLPLDHLESLQKTRNPCDLMNILAMVGKSIVVSLEATQRKHDELPPVATAADLPPSSAEMEPAEVEHDHSHAGGSPPRLMKKLQLSGDDMLPLFVLTLARSRSGITHASGASSPTGTSFPTSFSSSSTPIPFLLLRRWIELVGDANECTERAYYFTMYSAAVEYILAGDTEAEGGDTKGEEPLPLQLVAADMPSEDAWNASLASSPPGSSMAKLASPSRDSDWSPSPARKGPHGIRAAQEI